MTEMMLTEEDVTRILTLGYPETFFARKSEGFKLLKNSCEGRCVFHDGKTCTIYGYRPVGCKLYPIIYGEDLKLALRDSLCPYRKEFKISQESRRELSRVYQQLITEKSDRTAKAQNAM